MRRRIVQPTPFGPVAIMWTGRGGSPLIVRVLIPRAGDLYPESTIDTCPEIELIAESIRAFLCGENIWFSLESLDWSRCSAFQSAVLRATCGIPRGSVSSYRLIARHLGRAGGARAVGNSLAGNPYPLIVPCHRVIASDGRLGGFGGGPEMKQKLLAGEGVCFDNAGRVVNPVGWTYRDKEPDPGYLSLRRH